MATFKDLDHPGLSVQTLEAYDGLRSAVFCEHSRSKILEELNRLYDALESDIKDKGE